MLPSIFAPWCRPHHPADGGFLYKYFQANIRGRSIPWMLFFYFFNCRSMTVYKHWWFTQRFTFRCLPVCLSDCVILFSFPLFLTSLTVGVLCISEYMCVFECESGTHHTLRCRKTPSTCRGHRPLCPAGRQSNLEWEREREMRPLVM